MPSGPRGSAAGRGTALDTRLRLIVCDGPAMRGRRWVRGRTLVDRIVWARLSEEEVASELEPEGLRVGTELVARVRSFRVAFPNERGRSPLGPPRTPVAPGSFLAVDPEDRLFHVTALRPVPPARAQYFDLVLEEQQTRIQGGRPTFAAGVPAD